MTITEFYDYFVPEAKNFTMSGAAISLRLELYNQQSDYTVDSANMLLRLSYKECQD